MPARVLYAGPAAKAPEWRRHLLAAAAELEAEIALFTDPQEIAPEDVDYILYAPNGPVDDLRRYPRLKAIISLWAGVETIVERPDLPRDVPLTRMVDPGLTIGMTDFVVAHTLRRHVDIDATLERSAARRWDETHPPLSTERVVGVLGLGELGRDAAEKLAALRFAVRGWSRTPKQIEGVRSYAGPAELAAFLHETEILIVLLPLTPETRGLLNREKLALLPKSAYIINAARGPVLVEDDLIVALEDNIGGATLDVFNVEPLPQDHPFWEHPRVTVTPHIASVTRPETASKEVLRQIMRGESRQALRNIVDLTRGY